MAPVVHGLEAEYTDRMNFVYLDVDDPNTQELQNALGRRAQPEFYLLDADGDPTTIGEEKLHNPFVRG